jgi:L-ribulose-5-phosphate 4-epimerase
MDEKGVIKFNCTWIKEKPLENKWLQNLISWREKLYAIGFIGENMGIGYGNISIRYKKDQFIITGSATGKIKTLTNEHFTKVTSYDLDSNSIRAIGPIIASSESLTHAAIYETDPGINAVIHVHHQKLWEKLLNLVPSTDGKTEYGTPAMAREIKGLFKDTNLKEKKILAMAGHEEGIVSFGRDLDEAGWIIMDYFKSFNF